MKKYEFTGQTKNLYNGTVLHQIRALRNFGGVNAMSLGGWIEKEENLSHDGDAWVFGNAQVHGNAQVCGMSKLYICAMVSKCENYIVIGPIGSRNDFITFYSDVEGEISVSCGCFFGKLDDFLKEVEKTHGDNRHGKVYRIAAEMAKIQIELYRG